MSITKKTISGVKWTSMASIGKAVIGILQVSILTRFLEPSDFGLMSLILFLIGFIDIIMDMGLSSAILYKQKINKNEYASLYWLNVFFGLGIFLFVWGLSYPISLFYEEPELKRLIPISMTTIIIASFGRQFKIVKQKLLDFKFIAISDLLGFGLGLIVSSILAFYGFGVYALVYGLILRVSISNIIIFYSGIRIEGLQLRFNFKETRPFLKIGIYQVGGQVANYFNRDVDILIIGKIFGSEILGGYSLAKQLVQKPTRIINPIISTVASPVLALIQQDRSKLSTIYLNLMSYVSVVSFVTYLILGICSYPIVFILYGTDFTHISHIVSILCIYMFFRTVGNPIGSLLIATGRTDLDLKWNIIVLLIMPIFVIVGAQFSIEVVAIVLSLLMFLLTILSWKVIIKKLIPINLQQYMSSIFNLKFSYLLKRRLDLE